MLLKLQNPILNRSTTCQLVDKYRLLLADPVSAIGGLVFRSGVPPGIVMNHRIGSC